MEYYRFDYDPVIEALVSRAILEFEKGPSPRNRLAAAFLLPSMGLLSPVLVEKLPTLAARSLDKEVEKLLYLCNEQIFASATAGVCNTMPELHSFFENLPERLVTEDVLCLAYCLTHYSLSDDFPPALHALEEALRAKFEQEGRLFRAYSREFQPLSESFDAPNSYALLCLNLFSRYRRQGCLKSLNTALKIQDLLLELEKSVSDVLTISLLLLVLHRGEANVGRFYDSALFSLPADR